MTFLNKSFEQILVGRHHLSFVVALSLLHKRQSVLLIDDDRTRPDPLWGQFLGPLDFQYLQLWGIVDKIDELKALSHYVQAVPIKFYVGERGIYLPGSPFDNLNELTRWFPDIFDFDGYSLPKGKEDFNRDYGRGAERLGEVSFRMRNTQTIRPNFFEQMEWPFFDRLLVKAFQTYQTLLNTRPDHPFVQFINLGKSLYHKEVLLDIDEFEMGHLLLSFLGPFYRLDSKALEADLHKAFLEREGRYKKADINHWQIHGNELAHIELSSFEGVIPVEHCHLMGALSTDFPFSNTLDSGDYRTALYKIRSPGSFDLIRGERILYSQFDHLGSDLPLIDFYAPSPDLLFAFAAYRNRNRSKYNFYQRHLKDFLDRALQHILIKKENIHRLSFEVEEGESFWIHRKAMSFEKNCRTRKKQLGLVKTGTNSEGGKIHRIDYWGPLRCSGLGPFSYLLELREFLASIPGKRASGTPAGGDRGQTSVEYILLIGVLATILISLLPILRERLIGDGRCRGGEGKTVFCRIISSLALEGGNDGNYRYFTLRR